MNDNNLFVSILDTVATAEAAMVALRETIFWTVVNTTAKNIRVTENIFNDMKQTAKNAAQSGSVEFCCDDKTVDKFNFLEGDFQHQLRTLQKIYNTILQYNAWYCDEECEKAADASFGWQYNNHYYRFIFRR